MSRNFEGLLSVPREILRAPINVAEKVGGYALGIVNEAVEMVAPTYTQEEFVDKLMQEKPYADADCAIRTLATAEKAQQEAVAMAEAGGLIDEDYVQEVAIEKLEKAEVLRNIAYAMLKRTVVRAEKDPEIPDNTTRELVFRAREVGVDPERKGFVSQEEIPVVQQVFNKFDNVSVFPTIK